MSTPRKPYKSDVSDAEWASLLPYRSLMRADAPQREYPLRDVFDALRHAVKAGCQWDFLPHDLPPASAVYQQARRWVAAGVLEEVAHDLRMVPRLVGERGARPSAIILDSRAPQSTPASGPRTGFDGARAQKGSKAHIAVDTLGHPLALTVTAADDPDRARVAERTARVRRSREGRSRPRSWTRGPPGRRSRPPRPGTGSGWGR